MSFEIEKLELKENDVVVMHVETGNLPRMKAEKRCWDKVEEMRSILESQGMKNKIMVFPKNETNQSSIEVLPIKSDDDTLICNIYTGNMPKIQAESYVQKLSEQFKDVVPNKAIWFVKDDSGHCSEIIVEESE